jgi:hypothetical protein
MSEDRDLQIDAPVGTVDESTGLRWWKVGDDYYVTLDRERMLILAFRDLRRSRDGGGPVAQVTATEGGKLRRVGWAPLTLGSGTSRTSYARGCSEPIPVDRLMDACFLVSELFREGEPVSELEPDDSPPDAREWWIPQWVPRGHSTMLFGDADSAKSRLAMALAVAALTKKTLVGFDVQPLSSVLYLDWETDEPTHRRRLGRYLGPMNLPPPRGLYYRRMAHPIADDLKGVQQKVHEVKAELVIVDSYGMAAGGEQDSWHNSSLRFFDALRPLAVTALIIAHIAKDQALRETGVPTPWGSIYNRNLPRSNMFISMVTDSRDRHIKYQTVTHTKHNDSAEMPAVGLRYTFDEKSYWRIDGSAPDTSREPVRVQIRLLLRGGPKTGQDIGDSLGVSVETAERTLRRMKADGEIISLSGNSPGRGKRALWTLVTNRTEQP